MARSSDVTQLNYLYILNDRIAETTVKQHVWFSNKKVFICYGRKVHSTCIDPRVNDQLTTQAYFDLQTWSGNEIMHLFCASEFIVCSVLSVSSMLTIPKSMCWFSWKSATTKKPPRTNVTLAHERVVSTPRLPSLYTETSFGSGNGTFESLSGQSVFTIWPLVC